MSSLRTKSDFVIITWGTLQVNRPTGYGNMGRKR